MKKIFSIIIVSYFMYGCNGCSRSGRNQTIKSAGESESTYSMERELSRGINIVKMNDKGGVYEVPVEINGSNMNFIFDTGASAITISATEAMFLYKQGTLQQEDILGTQQYQIADGSISEGTVINLKTVRIGNKTLKNVKATILHNNEAPLLLGQSALAQFGKVSIDYNKKEITFE